MLSQNTICLTLPSGEHNLSRQIRETRVREIVVDHQISARLCLHIRKQIQETVATVFKRAFLPPPGSLRIQCQGTYLNNTALSEDDLCVFIIHDTSLSDKEIISALKLSAEISISPTSIEGTNEIRCSISLQHPGPKFRGRSPGPGQSQAISCTVEIIRLPSVRRDQHRNPLMFGLSLSNFEIDGVFTFNPCKVDITLVPADLRPLVCRQQFERFLKSVDHTAHLQYTTILLRLMARARGIESFSRGYLWPSLLQLFVYRYFREVCDQEVRIYSADIDHFNFAKYVCHRVSEFDYKNLIWSLDGDISAAGESLRVLHPTYPGYYLTPNVTPETTKTIIKVLLDIVEAETPEEFIGNIKAPLDLDKSGIESRRTEKRSLPSPESESDENLES